MAIDPLLNASWLHSPAVAQVFDVLGPDQVRLVGGCVRDGLLGLDVADIDFATTCLPSDVMAAGQEAGMTVIPTGIDHGTITLVTDGQAFEVTTLRKDVATDGRRAVVAFASDWRTDAARRDFTINALYADAKGQVSDYFGGLDDLADRKVRFIGAAQERIEEDALRILRFYRFSARFARGLDGEGRAACKAKASLIASLSKERIASEWLKLLGHDAPRDTLQAMADDGAIVAFLPEADIAPLEGFLSEELTLSAKPSALGRFSALLPAQEALVETVARRLKLSNAARRGLLARAKARLSSESPEAVFYRYGAEAGLDGLLLSGRADAAALSLAQAWEKPVFPIKAADVTAVSALEGPALGKALKDLEEAWIASNFTLGKSDLLALL